MPSTFIDIEGFGNIKLVKHKLSRSIKITIDGKNQIRITMPPWVPYPVAVKFLKTKKSWIQEHYRPTRVLVNGMAIGKSHRLLFRQSSNTNKVNSRILGTEIHITHPSSKDYLAENVQSAARKAAIRALKKQASILLPQRLDELADRYKFDFNELCIKQLRSRWGSCNQQKDITLNLYLMQLPWHLIDYVLLHELVHTEVLHHQKPFWDRFELCLPNAKKRRSELKMFQPML